MGNLYIMREIQNSNIPPTCWRLIDSPNTYTPAIWPVNDVNGGSDGKIGVVTPAAALPTAHCGHVSATVIALQSIE
uniref:Uncharacterized protein n=1 Tax=Pristionchus pacificus TaxID=54126 RepID=A0A2A6BQ76_PRIPA|eukprot:PDM68102.1 hypothetical protein PRIPAC_46146 [Pristionchus pacificus]